MLYGGSATPCCISAHPRRIWIGPSSHKQMIELQETIFQYLQEHPEQKKEFKRVSTIKGQSNILCLQVSRMIGELYTITPPTQ